MNTLPVTRNLLPVPTKEQGWEFLGGLIDPLDLEGGPMKLYVGFIGSCDVFALNEERVGFAGAIGIKSYDRWYRDSDLRKDIKGKAVELLLWPWMPAKDTPRGYADVFDPNAVLNMIWMFKETLFEEQAILSLLWMEVKMKHDRLGSQSAGYAIQLLTKSRELWPSTTK